MRILFLSISFYSLSLILPFPVQSAEERNLFDPIIYDEEVVPKLNFSGTTPTNVMLQGIGSGGPGAFAVINEEVYHEGEQKNGVEVVHIHQNSVDILINGIQQTLKITPDQSEEAYVNGSTHS